MSSPPLVAGTTASTTTSTAMTNKTNTSWLGRHLYRSYSLLNNIVPKRACEQVPSTVEVPLKDGQVLEYDISSQLPAKAEEISSLLKEEGAPPSTYLAFALEYYYKGGEDESFLSLLEDGINSITNTINKDSLIPLLTAKASYFIQKLLLSKGTSDKEELINSTIMQSLNEAEKINQLDLSLLLQKAFLTFSKASLSGSRQSSMNQLKILLQQAERSLSTPLQVGAHLLIAAQLYNEGGHWAAVLKHLGSISTLLPLSSPPELKLLEAVCLEHLSSQHSTKDPMDLLIGFDGFVGYDGTTTTSNNSSATATTTATTKNNNNNLKLKLNIHLVKGYSFLKRGLIKEGLEEIKKVYLMDPSNPNACLQIALHFFHSSNFERCKEFLDRAIVSDDVCNARLHSDLLLLRGRMEAIANGGDIDSAIRTVSQAVRRDPEHPLAQLFLGQLLIKSGGPLIAAGVECLQRVVELSPPSLDEDYHFWSLYCLSLIKVGGYGNGHNSGSVDVALVKDLLKRSLRLIGLSGDSDSTTNRLRYDLLSQASVFLDDYEMLSEAIALGERGSFEGLDVLKKNRMAKLLSDGLLLKNANAAGIVVGGEDPVSLLNMVIYLRRKGEFAEALLKVQRLIVLLDGRDGSFSDDTDIKAMKIKALLLKGCIEEQKGECIDANETFKEVISSLDEGSIDSWVLLSLSQWRSGAVGPARKSFERILKGLDRHEPFALHALGAMHYDFSFAAAGNHSASSSTTTAKVEGLKRSLEFYVKALQIRPGSYRALLGIGCVLGELGQWAEAKDCFITVFSSLTAAAAGIEGCGNTDADNGSSFRRGVLVNLAHCQLELSLYTSAIHSYREALSLVNGDDVDDGDGVIDGGDAIAKTTKTKPTKTKTSSWTKEKVQILCCLSRALYCSGSKEDLEEALAVLEDLIRHLPSDLMIQFNKGIVLLSLGELQHSKKICLLAKEALQSLDGKLKLKNLPIAIGRATDIINGITDKSGGGDNDVQSAETATLNRLKLVTLERERAAKKKAEEQEEVLLKRRLKEEESERIRRDLALKVKELDIRIGSGGDGDGDGDDGDGDAQEQEQPKVKKTKTKVKPKASKQPKAKAKKAVVESMLSKAEITDSDEE